MGRTKEEIKLNEKTGWFIGRYHQWRKLLPNGKLSTAERAQLIHKDSWEYNHFRDKDGVIHRGISKRYFSKAFTVADDVEVKGAELKDGLLRVSMERIIPEGKQARTIKVK